MKKQLKEKTNKLKRASLAVLAAGVLFFGHCLSCSANNLVIENVQMVKPNLLEGTVVISFDISWDNSWRNSVNFDAVWVFVKYTTDVGETWKHATLSQEGRNPEGTKQGEGAEVSIIVPSDRKGCFIERGSVGAGRVEVTGAEITWKWKDDGLEPEDSAEVKVVGIEMVYVPEGPFYAGDGGSLYSFKQGSGDSDPWYIQSEEEISVTNTASNGYYYVSAGKTGEDATGAQFNIPALFPKGFAAFYMMKYEATEGQWVDFFNMLTDEEKVKRDITDSFHKDSNNVIKRNTVSWPGYGLAWTMRPDRACSHLSWMDVAAYLDWAALRPMTELEFEKAARGEGITPVPGERAWGTINITAAVAISGSDEDGTETITTANANCCYSDQTFTGGDEGLGASHTKGPLRAGIFAKSDTTREEAGASYYGVMELSGNLWERPVTVGNSTGRAFQGTHGDGVLEIAEGYEGNATNSDWPGYTGAGEGVTTAAGAGFRGGHWELHTDRTRVSDRGNAAEESSSGSHGRGCRGVRTSEGGSFDV